MFPDQPTGSAIQLSGGQKKGAASTVHPISGSLAFGWRVSGLIIALNASRDAAPFFLPNTSQASDKGSVENLTNHPPPAMWLKGRLSLNKKGAPGSSPTKGALALGCQKLTSSMSARLRKENQSGSVTPTHSLIATLPRKWSTHAIPICCEDPAHHLSLLPPLMAYPSKYPRKSAFTEVPSSRVRILASFHVPSSTSIVRSAAQPPLHAHQRSTDVGL